MIVRPHRFLQHEAPQLDGAAWVEVPALDGAPAGPQRPVTGVGTEAPGGAARSLRLGVRLVTKQVARLLYLSPLLVVAKLALQGASARAADLVTFAFVLLVVAFFVLLNLYIVLSVVVHVASRGQRRVIPPFVAGAAASGGSAAEGRHALRVAGRIVGIGELLPGSVEVLRDMWALDGESPWRLVEAVDFAVVPDDGSAPVVVRVESAPLVVSEPEETSVDGALARFSPGTGSTFDVRPATSGAGGRAPAMLVALSEGDEVELAGVRRGTIANVGRFELGGRPRGLRSATRAADPYRGAGGEEGVLLLSTPDEPLWIRAR